MFRIETPAPTFIAPIKTSLPLHCSVFDTQIDLDSYEDGSTTTVHRDCQRCLESISIEGPAISLLNDLPCLLFVAKAGLH